MKKRAAAIAAVGGTVLAPLSATQAHAIDWRSPYPMNNCPNDYGCVSAYVQTVSCREISVRLYWPDRATRHVRVENDFRRAQQFAYPMNMSIDTRMPAVQTGWNVVRVWTPNLPARDVHRVVWVPRC